ncbi:hypothetical protein EYF80_023098 [Liparis tanakae]|uniref:Uncharacterized protein n=1 Tax=Liparis tanakae TaxID=230148 RepID=A0A4Z2HLC6_9TELE|nr:hypothetical protein EYF80_023098 [Liparis tanakae]
MQQCKGIHRARRCASKHKDSGVTRAPEQRWDMARLSCRGGVRVRVAPPLCLRAVVSQRGTAVYAAEHLCRHKRGRQHATDFLFASFGTDRRFVSSLT